MAGAALAAAFSEIYRALQLVHDTGDLRPILREIRDVGPAGPAMDDVLGVPLQTPMSLPRCPIMASNAVRRRRPHADVYSAGESETIVGKALTGGRRPRVVLATKAHGVMGQDINERGNSRRWLMRACKDTLRRLGTDYIDLDQIHRADPATDIDETLGALSDLIAAGKIRYAGCSTFSADQIVEAQWASQRRGKERFVCEQPPYSMLVRAIEADVLPACQRHRMGVIVWSPLAMGWLSGRFRLGADLPESLRAQRMPQRFDLSVPGSRLKLKAADKLAALADEAGMSLVHLALAFVLSHPAVTSAIVGPRTMKQLEGQLGAPEQLPSDLLDRIDEIVAPGLNVNPSDRGYEPLAVADASLRRRSSCRPTSTGPLIAAGAPRTWPWKLRSGATPHRTRSGPH